ncbi:MAG: serine/threonine protein kinase [Alphaproteobacteria bacterium]|nr:serine/threonine protein kinase [Alphaproteobacteria bacterium]
MSGTQVAFQFHNCLGEGGYGEVYLATQVTEGGIKRDVAVKVLHERYDEGSDAVKRLRDEGQVLAMLQHPAIVSVHQFCEIGGRLALVMEYIEGADVSYFCDRSRLFPPRIVMEVIREVAEALAHALTVHNPLTGRALGMIHRDIKPANVRVTVDGKVKLMDFGVARSNEIDRKAKTAMGDVLLTPGFGAPEALGFGVSGPMVDVFALGVTMFEMCTGQTFYGKTDLAFQVSLAMDSEDYNSHLEERLALIENEDLRKLCGDMLKFQHELRPEAADIADRAHAMWKKMEGDTLGKWARHTQFPDLSYDTAEFCGKLIDARGTVLGDAPPPKPPDPSPNYPGSPPSLPPEPGQFKNAHTLDLTHPPPAERVSAPMPKKPAPPAPPAPQGSNAPLIIGAAAVFAGLAMFGIGILALLAAIFLS